MARDFLGRLGLKMMVRSHQCVEKGWEVSEGERERGGKGCGEGGEREGRERESRVSVEQREEGGCDGVVSERRMMLVGDG